MRILEVNNHSLLGMTHTEAVRVLRAVGDSLSMLVCDGFDPRKVSTVEVRRHERLDLECFYFWRHWNMYNFVCMCCFVQASPGIIANPFAAGIVRKNSMESISSIDRDLSPEEMDIMQKVQEITRCFTLWSDVQVLSLTGS